MEPKPIIFGKKAFFCDEQFLGWGRSSLVWGRNFGTNAELVEPFSGRRFLGGRRAVVGPVRSKKLKGDNSEKRPSAPQKILLTSVPKNRCVRPKKQPSVREQIAPEDNGVFRSPKCSNYVAKRTVKSVASQHRRASKSSCLRLKNSPTSFASHVWSVPTK